MGASLSPEMTFLTPKTERSPSLLVSLLTDIGSAGFPSALRQRIPAIHFENLWEFSTIWQDHISHRGYNKSTSLFILQHLMITSLEALDLRSGSCK